MEIGLVRKVDIDHEMQQSYLDYAMSVIVSRALPDARDGLKPVQRRILYAMYDMGLRPDSEFKKSARIVGEVLGKYHPHGDMAVYEAMARLAQDFTMRYTLVNGQGNFGSVDGDPPAAMRYTEARLTQCAMQLMADIDRDTVNFDRNFDDSLDEPSILPAAVPGLLVNGASGIAVGMATNIPPHNLGEVVDALSYMIENWEHQDDVTVEDLMRFIKGPDFPTGGVILQENQQNELLSAYATGRGRVLVRGRVHLEEMGRGRSRVIINELPYLVNKSSLIERIAELVREGHLEGISDLRDESDRQGMRIVIELKQGANEESILRELYQRTSLQMTQGITLLALVDGEPHTLTLKQALRVYLEHRLEVVRRRCEFDLARAKARAHILEGLRIAIDNLDEIIKVIRSSPDTDEARERLMKKFKLSQVQAVAILDMPLKRLSALERKKIEDEYKGLQAQIKELEALLKSPKKLRGLVEEELKKVKQTFDDRRRTQIVYLKEGEVARDRLVTTDITPAEPVWVGITADGVINRTRTAELPAMTAKVTLAHLIKTDTHHTIYLVAADGRAAAVAVHSLPDNDHFGEGAFVHKASPFPEGEKVVAVFSVPNKNGNSGERFFTTISEGGMVKKSVMTDLPGPSAQTFYLSKVNAGDRIIGCLLTTGNDELLVATQGGMAIRFSEGEVRSMGLIAAGVNAMKLSADDKVAGAAVVQKDGEIIIFSATGKGWRMAVDEFPVQGRYGMGVNACKLLKDDRLVGVVIPRKPQAHLLSLRQGRMLSIKQADIESVKRARNGVAVLDLKGLDQVEKIIPQSDSLIFWGGAEPEPEEKTARAKKAGESKAGTGTGKAAAGKTAAKSTRKAEPKAKKPAAKADAKSAPKAAPKSAGKAGKAKETKPAAPKPVAKKPAAKKSDEKSAAVQASLLDMPADSGKAASKDKAPKKETPAKPASVSKKPEAKPKK